MHFVSDIVCLKTKDSLGDDPSAERHALFRENISHLFLNRSLLEISQAFLFLASIFLEVP